jgi:hypothetical protein
MTTKPKAQGLGAMQRFFQYSKKMIGQFLQLGTTVQLLGARLIKAANLPVHYFA